MPTTKMRMTIIRSEYDDTQHITSASAKQTTAIQPFWLHANFVRARDAKLEKHKHETDSNTKAELSVLPIETTTQRQVQPKAPARKTQKGDLKGFAISKL